jgi:hypothetical protein
MKLWFLLSEIQGKAASSAVTPSKFQGSKLQSLSLGRRGRLGAGIILL